MSTKECFFRWGINEKNLVVGKYRFNKNFHAIGADEFLKDLMNDKTVLNTYMPFRGMNECTGVKFTQLNCNVLNMSYFDMFHDLNLVMGNGDIKGCFEERQDGIIIMDKIR